MFKQLTDPGQSGFHVYVDGEAVIAHPGDTVAAVLLRTPPYVARHTPVRETPRAPFCLMGVCFDCLATVDDRTSVQTCLVEARPGMRIERPRGKLKVAQ
ncbi:MULTISPECIES: (2Fe-2S)-binding protein [Nitratireductor]|uniref:2Fe-2S iron-sulfur cluster binding domain-containing protein n=1 Tax=Nitratireductor aquibiodomus TaxID=204799 RepID=A0A1H4JD13_9HYPH|nr:MULTISPECIES: (2Fe-2S)-binding protein [Nitratireductor]MCV0381180.1 (2Fe-2S)-binding protein [Nitratireductor sp.]SEB43886.1 2Fe-2S iron-sulfur cluster binding domain-containing protein [Nitratireductor aquibiodomus]